MDIDRPVAELKNVSVHINGQPILNDINLKIEANRVVAVIGASGSGKSTLLRLLNGLQPASGGTVLRDAEPLQPESLRATRMNTGYALQQIGLLPHLTARSNIALPMTLAGWAQDRSRARIDTLRQRLQLTDAQLDRFPAALSGGQQQRVGLCRAMALHPDLLLLDEAFSGLDAITRNDTYVQFEAVRQDEINACLLVTHDLAEAARLADELIILRDGRIVRQGARDAVLNDPQDAYAQQLIETFT
ncbi:MAG: ATP-binding cassette domain-containing protein [Pseudomonadota bacterium]